MPYRADVTEPDPNIISKYLSEPGPARRVPTGPVGLGSGIYPLNWTHFYIYISLYTIFFSAMFLMNIFLWQNNNDFLTN